MVDCQMLPSTGRNDAASSDGQELDVPVTSETYCYILSVQASYFYDKFDLVKFN